MNIFFDKRVLTLGLFLLIPVLVFSQDQELFRGSIPEEILRPARGETARYPFDIVIGRLGSGNASAAAYSFANTAASALLSGKIPTPASVNSDTIRGYISALDVIKPVSFRIGSGRNEPDGAVSFLIRFIGRESGIT